MRFGRVSLHPHINSGAPGVLGQRLGFWPRAVAAGVLNQQGRKPGEISEQGAHARVIERVPCNVGRAHADEFIQHVRACTGSKHGTGQVEVGAQQRGPSGHRLVAGLEAEQNRQ